ncbi:MAG TPA: hypothetical protein VM939_05450 [Gemmatimonadaceae bacterium]|nr:hypothetical protein [Gemmatimonadaceae bacterium]
MDKLREELTHLKALCTRVLVIAPIILASACDRNTATASTHVVASRPAGIVDSILPMDDAVRRFRVGLPGVNTLSSPARSRESLLGSFLHALARNDERALRTLVVGKAEYAYLYFPTSRYAAKPYELAPDIAWTLNHENSEKGFRRLLTRLGGQKLNRARLTCGDSISEGANTFLRSCEVSYMNPVTRSRISKALFGPIMMRDGKFKLLSYSNDF